MTTPLCRCGHERRDHSWRGDACDGLGDPIEDGSGLTLRPACPCAKFDDGVLPAPGERPVFGVHRLPSAEAAWTTEPESSRDRRFREFAKGALRDPDGRETYRP